VTEGGAESFLVMHGIGNHRPPEHWQFWISAQLAAAGHQVLYPGFPEPDKPSFAAWSRTLLEQLDAMRHLRRTVICHSLSCLLWFAIAPDVDGSKRPTRLLLVAPPDPKQVPPAGSEFLRGFSAAAVAASATDEIRVVCSDADPYNPGSAERMYAEPIGCAVDVIDGAGHITPETGYGAWPSLRRWSLRETASLSANL
jgi:hypothetical protein